MSKVILSVSGSDTVTVGTIEFWCPFDQKVMATRLISSFITPVGMTVSDLFIEHNTAQAVSEQTVIVEKDATNTALTLNIPIATGGFTSDTTHSFHINAGQNISISFDSPAGSTAAQIRSVSMVGTLDG